MPVTAVTQTSILIVEDNQAQIDTLTAILEQREYRVTSCKTGQASLAACLREKFNLIILDLSLPDMNGMVLLKKLRQVYPHLKVIILTGNATVDVAMESVNQGAFAFLRKAGDVHELLDHIDRACLVLKNELLDDQLKQISQDLWRSNQELQVEITRRKQSESMIQASLDEKELLLQEIHHRVKNNLQVISSLLNLQSDRIQDTPFSAQSILRIFEETQHRIDSIALIHEKLYQTENLSKINFIDYLQEFTQNLFYAYGVDTEKIRFNLQGRSIILGVDLAIPCALIFHELLSNSLKYAFPNGESGWIDLQIEVVSAESLRLIYSDSGTNFPKNLDFRTASSLGMELIHALVHQIQGSIQLDTSDRTTFTLIFPIFNLHQPHP